MSGGSRAWVLAVVAVMLALFPAAAHAAVGDVSLISRATAETPASDGDSGPGVAVSAEGRYVAFESRAANLTDGAQPGPVNIYVRDRRTGTTTLVSRADGPDGAGGDGDSTAPSISPAGRYVAFQSTADNLSTEDDDSVTNVYLRDTWGNTTTLVSRAADGSAANGDSSHPAVTGNASFVAFASTADNLSADDNDAFSNVYVRNTETGEVTVVSRVVLGQFSLPADGDSWDPTIDGDGRRVAFTSNADNLSSKDDNSFTNVFVTDLQTKFTSAVSLPTGGFLQQGPSDGDSGNGVISTDGRYVAFVSYADNFVDEPIRTPTIADVFRRDIQASKTELVSRGTGVDGAPAFADSTSPTISGDGRFVAFQSVAGNLSSEDTAAMDLFLRNMDDGTTTLLSRATGAAGPVADASSYAPVLSRAGAFVVFSSDAANLSDLDDDSAPVRDVYIRRLRLAPPPVDTGPDLGSNDHSEHTGHDPSSPDHAGGHTGHTADEHAGHATPTGGPAMTLFGPPIQDIDKLYMLLQPHAAAKVLVAARLSVRGRGRRARVLRFRSFSASVPAHKQLRIKFKMAKSKLRLVKRALRRHRPLKVKIVGKAQNAAGGPWTTITRVVRLRD